MKRVIGVALALVMVITISACGLSDGPEYAFDQAMKALINNDAEGVDQYFLNDDAADDELEGVVETDDEMAEMIFGNLSYDVVSVEEEGDEAYLTVDITNVDMALALPDYLEAVFDHAYSDEAMEMTEEEADAKYAQFLADAIEGTDEVVTNTVVVTVVNDDGNWRVSIDDEFADALLGGMISAMDEMMGGGW